jgi:hypothetical protein
MILTTPCSRRAGVIAALLFCSALTLYSMTLAPSVAAVFDDSLEFQLVTYELGIAHPTGYPLFTLLGWLFTRLPVGDVAYRVNLMSALFGAVTSALTYLLGRALAHKPEEGALCHQWPAEAGAVLGALAVTVSPVVWSQATLAEVYTLNAAIVAAILLGLVQLARAASEGVAESRGGPRDLDRRFLFVTGLLGLGLAHHRTVLLLVPAAAFLLWRRRRRWSLRPALLAAFVAPLLLYLYLPLRGHVGSLDGSYANTLAGFVRHVTASSYGAFLTDNPLALDRTPAFYVNLFVEQFGWLGLLAGLAGLIVLWRRTDAFGVTLIAFLTYGLFNWFYQVADIEVFFIPMFILWAAWSGLGAGWLLQEVRRGGHKRLAAHSSGLPFRIATVVIGLALVAQSGLILAANLPERDRARDWQSHDYGIDMLSQSLPTGAAIVGIQGEITLIRYFQATRQMRTDVMPVAADAPEQRRATVDKLLEQNHSVYLTRDVAGAAQRWSLSAQGPLIRVRSQPVLIPPDDVAVLDTPLTPHIDLYGYAITRPVSHAVVPPVRLNLIWHARTTDGPALKVSARLLASDGRMVAQADAVPVHFAYPTSAWRAGEYVSDAYDLPLPDQLPAGSYTPLVILYDPARDAAEVGRATLPALHLP